MEAVRAHSRPPVPPPAPGSPDHISKLKADLELSLQPARPAQIPVPGRGLPRKGLAAALAWDDGRWWKIAGHARARCGLRPVVYFVN